MVIAAVTFPRERRRVSARGRSGIICRMPAQARHIARNVLEWRLDPACEHRDPEAARRDRLLIVMCDEGYQSSFAAVMLQRFGLQATDVIGGFPAWRSAGLPIEGGG